MLTSPKVNVQLSLLKFQNMFDFIRTTPNTGAETSLIRAQMLSIFNIDVKKLDPPTTDYLIVGNQKQLHCIGILPVIFIPAVIQWKKLPPYVMMSTNSY